jgi:hypothetical protein
MTASNLVRERKYGWCCGGLFIKLLARKIWITSLSTWAIENEIKMKNFIFRGWSVGRKGKRSDVQPVECWDLTINQVVSFISKTAEGKARVTSLFSRGILKENQMALEDYIYGHDVLLLFFGRLA